MKPTRISARQAEAKQRISQIHDPSGSAPPFESTPPSVNRTYYWRFNPGKSEEIQLLHDMLQHLHDDPHTPDTMEMFKFMLRERPQLEANIQTNTEREKLKARLIELSIRYIHWNPLTGDWSYWTTYTKSAMQAYYRTPKDDDKPDIQASPLSGETRESDQNSDAIHPHTPQARTNRSSHNTPETAADASVVYLQTVPPSSPSVDSDSDNSRELEAWIQRTRAKDTDATSIPAKQNTTSGYPTSAGYPTPALYTSHGTDYEQDNEGFSRVPLRRTRPDKTPHFPKPHPTEQASQNSRHEKSLSEDRKLPPMEITVPREPPDEMRTTTLDSATKATMWAKLDEREDKLNAILRAHERKLEQAYRQHNIARLDHLQKLADHDARMLVWETSLERRENQFDNNMTTVATVFATEKERHDEYIRQAHLSIKAWTDVSIGTLKKELDDEMGKQKTRILAYCEDQMQITESHLEGYAEHARGTQAKLLVRLRSDILATYDKTHAEAKAATQTVTIDDDPAEPQNQKMAPDDPRPHRFAHINVEGFKDTRFDQHHNTDGNMDSAQQNPTWTSTASAATKYSDPHQQISRLRSAHTPVHLRGRDRKAVQVFYNSFVDFHRIYRVPLKRLDEIRIDKLDDEKQQLYPSALYDSDPELLAEYGAAIYARLEEPDVLDPSESLYEGLLDLYNSSRDGYALLKAILAATLMVHSHDIGRMSTPPTVQPGMTPYTFASNLTEFFRGQELCDRTYTPTEQAMMFLQSMGKEPRYTLATQQLIHELKQVPASIPLPKEFRFPTLPLTVQTHPAANTSDRTTATLQVTQGYSRSGDTTRRSQQHPSDTRTPSADRGHSRDRDRRSSSLDSRRPRQYDTNSSRSGRSNQSASRSSTQPRNMDIQCKACATNGHTHLDCRLFPKVAAIVEYMTMNPSEAKDSLQQYRKAQHPDARKAAREKYVKVLQGRISDPDELQDMVDQLEGDYWWPDQDDDHSASICRMVPTLHPHLESTIDIILQPPMQSTSELRKATHPVMYPDMLQDLLVRQPLPPETRQDVCHFPSHQAPMCVTQCDTRRDLADTGASVSATGRLDILHDFTPRTPYDIMGYDGRRTRAAGQGMARIQHPTTGEIEEMFFVYIPAIQGTIVSLEHHAKTHPNIHRWTQEATPATQSGWVTFLDANDQVVSRYETVQNKGLYYMQDLNFIPVTVNADTASISQLSFTTTTPHDDDRTIRTGTRGPTLDSIDFDMPLHLENAPAQLQPRDAMPQAPLITATRHSNVMQEHVIYPPDGTRDHTISRMGATTIEKDVLNFETWHQRTGHCSEQRLRKTQQLVDGIPTFRTATLPHVINCRTCDVAKLKKAPRGPPTTQPATLQYGQVFNIDLGFIRGPANLAAVLDRTEETQPKLVESRQGYTCYLLLIDTKSRYTWVFPLKSKSVPLTLLKIFLETHGNHNCRHRRIRTDGEGSLAESHECRKLFVKLGYTMQKTATDSSSQNGLAERPHQTLAAMVRCLLYSASLPVTFWADALVYSVYINNRLYNTGIDGIPYTAWTGQRANMRHLRAFGAHVSVRRSGHRPTKTDPHYYNGRFLRFSASEKNIIYIDTVTKRDKVARHCVLDEFHYSTPRATRPLGAQQLLDRVLPNHVPPADKVHAPPDPTDHGSENAQHITLDEAPPELDVVSDSHVQRQEMEDDEPTTATAAQLLTEEHQQALLHMEPSTDMYASPVIVRLPMNNLPTLGILVRHDTATSKLYVQGCQDGTQASRITRWRSTIKNAVLRTVDDVAIHSEADLRRHIAAARARHATHVTFSFAKHAITKVNEDDDMPQLHFDQLRHINQMHAAMREPIDEIMDAFLHYTRAQLRKLPDFQTWRESEWAQHDKYLLQNMFGDPILRPHLATVLPFVWTYLIKEDPITGDPKYKARATCNGGKKYGKAVTVAETYATCVEQPACRLYWAITASQCLIAMGADAGNAFAEAPPATEPFYMRIDDQFREWWEEHLGRPPIPPGYVLPVNHALQGHPEAPRLWEKHIHTILVEKLHFIPTTHEKCLYSRRSAEQPDELEMILRQVDDFSVSATSQDRCQSIIALIGAQLTVPLNDLGIIRKFNGVNIQQTRWFIKISCQDYIQKIILNHQWQELKASNLPLPMRSDSKYQRQLELAERPADADAQNHIQKQAGFSFRMSTGELIYALVVCRMDISFAIIKLCQYNSNPALIHYQAAKNVFAYLNNTQEDGLIYWRSRPRMDLPDVTSPTARSNPQDFLPTPKIAATSLLAYSDSDWGSDASHRRSVTGTIILLSGAAVLYTTRYQKAVALSSTEAEFVSASEAGKMTIYMRTLLNDLGLTQNEPTTLMIDNTGAVFMVDAGAPTRRTRHVDIRYFALLEWSDSGQLKAEAIPTDMNISDSLTKATGRIKFHQHADIYMGRVPPHYVPLERLTHTTLTESLAQLFHVSSLRTVTVPMNTLSALHHPNISAFILHVTDFSPATEHGRVRGYSS